MCTPFWEKLQFGASKYRCYRVLTSKTSTDLDRGRRPELKSVEFFDVRTLELEEISILVEISHGDYDLYNITTHTHPRVNIFAGNEI